MSKSFVKAKRKVNNQWVEGYLYCPWSRDGEGEKAFIVLPQGNMKMCAVNKDTVCRATGEKDIDGIFIYERDVVCDMDGTKYTVVYVCGDEWHLMDENNRTDLLLRDKELKVIGNILDDAAVDKA